MSRTITLTAAFCWILIGLFAVEHQASAFNLPGHTDAPTAFTNLENRTLDRIELPAYWDCTRREGVERIRRLAFCRVMGGDEAAKPSARPVGDRVIRYRLLVEKGLEKDADGFVEGVERVLNAPTSWTKIGVRFVRVHERYDFTVLLASPHAVDRLCRPLKTQGWLSCALNGRAIINLKRWRDGAITWRADVRGYHNYLINHEVGHVLGLRHARCPGPGQPAPIMLPQTKFLNGCTANGEATQHDLAMLNRVLPRFTRIAARRRGVQPVRVATRTGPPVLPTPNVMTAQAKVAVAGSSATEIQPLARASAKSIRKRRIRKSRRVARVSPRQRKWRAKPWSLGRRTASRTIGARKRKRARTRLRRNIQERRSAKRRTARTGRWRSRSWRPQQ